MPKEYDQKPRTDHIMETENGQKDKQSSTKYNTEN